MSFELMCPRYEKAAELLGRKWNGLIFRALIEGPRRFTEVREYVGGLSDRLLSQRLKELEDEGVVERRVHASRPVTVDYALTAKGADLRRVVEAIQTWADKWEAEAVAKEVAGRH